MGQKKHKSCLDNILMEPKLTMEVKIENNWAILIAFNSKLTVKFPLSSKRYNPFHCGLIIVSIEGKIM